MGRAENDLNTTKNPPSARLTVVVPEQVLHRSHCTTKPAKAAAGPSYLWLTSEKWLTGAIQNGGFCQKWQHNNNSVYSLHRSYRSCP